MSTDEERLHEDEIEELRQQIYDSIPKWEMNDLLEERDREHKASTAYLRRHHEITESALGILSLTLPKDHPASQKIAPYRDELHSLHDARMRELGAEALLQQRIIPPKIDEALAVIRGLIEQWPDTSVPGIDLCKRAGALLNGEV